MRAKRYPAPKSFQFLVVEDWSRVAPRPKHVGRWVGRTHFDDVMLKISIKMHHLTDHSEKSSRWESARKYWRLRQARFPWQTQRY